VTPLDARAAGRAAADLYRGAADRLFADLVDAGAAPAGDADARMEWDAFALFACVRGLVAASGFVPRTVDAIDALHGEVLGDEAGERRALIARRYSEYETIAQAGGASAAAEVPARLGAAVARHLGTAEPVPDLAELLGSIHESLAEAVVALVSGDASSPAAPPALVTPPFAGAHDIVARLEAAGIEVALGGSGLLAALGLTRIVHDWDLTTDAPRAAVESALVGLAWMDKGSDALHADEKLMFPDRALEIIRGFAFFVPGGVVHIPTRVTGRWNELPLGSPEAWAVAYALLGRDEKSGMLFDWLRRHGADSGAIEVLLGQPLPDAVAAKLRALERRS